MLFLTGIAIILSVVIHSSTPLRFTHNPIQVDKGLLEVGAKTKLTCNYVRFRTESIRRIRWRFEYNGVSGTFYDYHVSTGAKDSIEFPFLTVPEDAEVSEKEVEVVLNDFRAPDIKFICEVDALRDNGYGKLHQSSKKAHGIISVVDTSNWSLRVSPDPEHKRKIERDEDSLSFKCISKGAVPPPSLSFSIKGQNLSDFGEGAVVRHVYESQDESVIEGRLNGLPPSLFETGHMRQLVVRCYAKYGDSVLGKSDLEMLRVDHVPRRGKDVLSGVSYDEGKEIDKRFLKTSDPARSVHPLFPIDTFDGYVIMVADNVNPENDYVTPHVTLLGPLPSSVKGSLAERLYGRLNNLSPEKIMLKVDAANLLNMMGTMGYRVVSSTSSLSGTANKLIWTLERRKVSDAYNNREL